MPTFLIDGDCAEILARLFDTDDRGHLQFGYPANSSTAPADAGDLLTGFVQFADYICEGAVNYGVRAEDRNPGCLLTVMGEGSNRDQYIRRAVRHYITGKNLVIASEGA